MTRRTLIPTLSLLVAGALLGALGPDPALPAFVNDPTVSGTVRVAAGPAVDSVVDGWAKEYRRLDPDSNMDIKSTASDDAVAALLAGTCDVAVVSRPMKEEEKAAYRKKFSSEAVPVAVGIDALAVYVNKSNPAKGLTLQQLDSVFSSDKKRGGKEVSNWGDLGLTGGWAQRPVVRFGSNPDAGGSGYFRSVVLKGGGFHESLRSQSGPGGVVSGVGAESGGIGYAGVRRATQRTRVLPIINDRGIPVLPSVETCMDGSYPLAGRVYAYVSNAGGKGFSPNVKEFLTLALSLEGQAVVDDSGLFPLPASVAVTEREKLK